MKIIKRIGPNIDPWEAPILTGLSENLALLIVVCCFQSSRKDLNYLFNLPCIPQYSSFFKKILKFTVSKACQKSKTTPQVNFPKSQPFFVISIVCQVWEQGNSGIPVMAQRAQNKALRYTNFKGKNTHVNLYSLRQRH